MRSTAAGPARTQEPRPGPEPRPPRAGGCYLRPLLRRAGSLRGGHRGPAGRAQGSGSLAARTSPPRDRRAAARRTMAPRRSRPRLRLPQGTERSSTNRSPRRSLGAGPPRGLSPMGGGPRPRGDQSERAPGPEAGPPPGPSPRARSRRAPLWAARSSSESTLGRQARTGEPEVRDSGVGPRGQWRPRRRRWKLQLPRSIAARPVEPAQWEPSSPRFDQWEPLAAVGGRVLRGLSQW